MSAKKDKAAAAAGKQVICQNRKATHDYAFHTRLEAGLVLTGSEVKSCRAGEANLNEGYVLVHNGEAFLHGGYIGEYREASHFGHSTDRTRKLLLHRREIDNLEVRTRQKGEIVIPLALYFKDGNVKVELGVGKGKTEIDRRDTIKERESQREVDRIMRRSKR